MRQNCLISELKTFWTQERAHWASYPVITEREALCAYYLKRNRQSMRSLFVLSTSLVGSEVFRILLAFLFLEPLDAWMKWGYVWIAIDLAIVVSLLICGFVLKDYKSARHRGNLEYQTSVRGWMQVCSLMDTVTFMLSPHLLPTGHNSTEMASLAWVVFNVIQLQVCLWTVDGLWFKSFLMVLFNAGYCASASYWGLFQSDNLTKSTVPVFLSLAIFVAFDRQTKMGFLLKRTLYKQKAMYEQHLEKAQDPVAILSNSQLLFSNEASRKRLGSTVEQFWERMQYVIAEDGECLGERVRRKLREQAPASADLAAKTTLAGTVSQDKYYFHDTDSEVISYDKVLNVTMIESIFFGSERIVSLAFQDITEALRGESRIEEKYKNMLLFSLSHELRTPLNTFQALLEISKRTLKGSADYETYRDAKGAWRYLRNKISDIFDYAQILSGEFKLHKARIALRSFVVKHMQKMTYCMLGSKRNAVRLEFSVDPRIDDEFLGDRERLEQVLFNLLSNAVKWTAAGSISFRVHRQTKIPNSTPALVFKVADTGCGMSPTFVASLFAFRDSCAAESLNGGERGPKTTGLSGLGLTVSRMICNRMGSDIAVSSDVGKGSTFSFRIPLETSSEILVTNPAVPEEGVFVNSCVNSALSVREAESRRAFVLVVDDNELNRHVVRGMTEKLGFEVQEADNGRRAVDSLEDLRRRYKNRSVVVFMDLDMPVMGGIEATLEIRRKGDMDTRIVALTAFASESERTKCMEVGMDGFISKPLTKESLVDSLRQLGLLTD